jgi:GAF domain-containing protein
MVASGDADAMLTTLLADLVSLYDVDAGMIFVTDGDGLSLRRAAALGERSQHEDREPPESIRLGEGPLGRVALERRAQLVQGSVSRYQTSDRATLCVPMIAGPTMVGVICLVIRPSRLVGRGELLLLQAFANRVAQILLSSADHRERRLKAARERFRVSWLSSSRH